ncbi:hypothetical protein [Polaromonas naphthalenivorans]|uniref:hypothetical protein n=1 Tax=Polaromonas naphthalenivorans TaxID=216465 RepID=UPI0012ED6F25|nr:hypothetical protein [Polaromonas naphthalenivorans]
MGVWLPFERSPVVCPVRLTARHGIYLLPETGGGFSGDGVAHGGCKHARLAVLTSVRRTLLGNLDAIVLIAGYAS